MIIRPFQFIAYTIGLLAISCTSPAETDKAKDGGSVQGAFARNVKTTRSVISNQEKEMTLTGKVITDPDKTIKYMPLISGLIERTYFSLGDKVEKGQTLIDIRSTEVSALFSKQVALEAEIRIAERALKTTKEMFDDNLSSEKDLLEAESRLKQTRSALEKLKNDMAIFGTNKGNGVFSIKAPVSGYIIYKNASPGSTISPDSEPLFIIADLNTVWIMVNVYASHLQFVKEGMEASITTLSYPNEVFKGKIVNLSQVFDPDDKALKARIILPNKEMKLKPEMSVVVKLKDTTQNGLVAIPSEALIFDNDSYFAVIFEGGNNYAIREVIPYDRNKNTTYITSGLSEGEDVVIKNQLLIYSELKGK